ncbi:MAG: ParB/RepB/Spo0J family partition protein [Gammaproteobacteria bacterium]|nr:ParB/RepB/Spo0J family partition protein [Gammaproteobacteria bacterium]
MVSLFGRKRTSELSKQGGDLSEAKKDELLALKLQQIDSEARETGNLQMLPITLLRPDPNQPRKVFRNIDALSASVKEKGIIQPIIVTKKNQDGLYTLIAGERRYRAALQAGLASIPCIIRDESDANIVILQLLENDQRENVSPLEESDALAKLIDEMQVSKTRVAQELGRDIGWVSIRLGLQRASEGIRELVKEGIIEDVRTLHELRMFEEEQPEKAKRLIARIRTNTVSGSYRQVIANCRREKKEKTPDDLVRAVSKVERFENELIFHVVGKKRPLRFTLTPEVLHSLIQASQQVLEETETQNQTPEPVWV